jgi:hypothetical protein
MLRPHDRAGAHVPAIVLPAVRELAGGRAVYNEYVQAWVVDNLPRIVHSLANLPTFYLLKLSS